MKIFCQANKVGIEEGWEKDWISIATHAGIPVEVSEIQKISPKGTYDGVVCRAVVRICNPHQDRGWERQEDIDQVRCKLGVRVAEIHASVARPLGFKEMRVHRGTQELDNHRRMAIKFFHSRVQGILGLEDGLLKSLQNHEKCRELGLRVAPIYQLLDAGAPQSLNAILMTYYPHMFALNDESAWRSLDIRPEDLIPLIKNMREEAIRAEGVVKLAGDVPMVMYDPESMRLTGEFVWLDLAEGRLVNKDNETSLMKEWHTWLQERFLRQKKIDEIFAEAGFTGSIPNNYFY